LFHLFIYKINSFVGIHLCEYIKSCINLNHIAMNNKALIGFAVSVAGVVAGLYLYKYITTESTDDGEMMARGKRGAGRSRR